MRKLSLPLIIGFSLAIAGCNPSAPPPADTAMMASSAMSVADLVMAPDQVKTDGWLTYANDKMGFTLIYPKTFVVSEQEGEVIIKRDVETSSDMLAITVQKSTLTKEVGKRFYRARDIRKLFGSPQRPMTTAIARYDSGDAGSWFMTYFIARDADLPSFPDFEEKSPAYDVLVAEVEAFPPETEIGAAMQADRIDELLSEPQQILSTLRFTR